MMNQFEEEMHNSASIQNLLQAIANTTKVNKELLFWGFETQGKDDLSSLYLPKIKKSNVKMQCALVTLGILRNTNGQNVRLRKDLIAKKLISAVILLPPKLYKMVGVQTAFIIIKPDSDSITFIDASTNFVKEKHQNLLTKDICAEIAGALETAATFETATTVSTSDIPSPDFVLSPSVYLEKKGEALKNPVPFETIITSISRGYHGTSKELYPLYTKDETEFQLLKVSDIQHGEIQKDLEYLTHLDKNMVPYCLEEGDIIISKAGAPFKVAIATNLTKNILPTMNFFIIKIDQTKADPQFIKTWLSSPAGMAALSAKTVGATIPSLAKASLLSLEIPSVSIEEQQEFVLMMKETEKQIAHMQKSIDELHSKVPETLQKLTTT